MKMRLFALVAVLINMSCNSQTEEYSINFQSEKISKTASFVSNADIETVFPLFGAFEERKWAPHWEPILIYPEQEIIEEGTTFKVNGHGHGDEKEFLWIVTKLDLASYLIQYLVSTDNRFWTITVQSENTENDTETKTTVTYSFTGLNEKGNTLNHTALEKMYENNLQDWGKAINDYLEKQ